MKGTSYGQYLANLPDLDCRLRRTRDGPEKDALIITVI